MYDRFCPKSALHVTAPSLNVFDASEGLSTCTRRIRSNTPLQALTLMNDSAFFEFATALQKVIDREGIQVRFASAWRGLRTTMNLRCSSGWIRSAPLVYY